MRLVAKAPSRALGNHRIQSTQVFGRKDFTLLLLFLPSLPPSTSTSATPAPPPLLLLLLHLCYSCSSSSATPAPPPPPHLLLLLLLLFLLLVLAHLSTLVLFLAIIGTMLAINCAIPTTTMMLKVIAILVTTTGVAVSLILQCRHINCR